MRTNKSGVTEVAHLRTDLDEYGKNYDRIFNRPLNDFELDRIIERDEMKRKEVSYVVRNDGLYVCYLLDDGTGITGPEEWTWDNHYRTAEEFELTYKDYIKSEISDEWEE